MDLPTQLTQMISVEIQSYFLREIPINFPNRISKKKVVYLGISAIHRHERLYAQHVGCSAGVSGDSVHELQHGLSASQLS